MHATVKCLFTFATTDMTSFLKMYLLERNILTLKRRDEEGYF